MRKSFNTLKVTLDEFCNFFDLLINSTKSHISFSTSLSDKDELEEVLNLPIHNLSFDYMGVLMIGKMLKLIDCAHHLISSLQEVHTRWEGRYISYSRRIQLLQWIFFRKFNYILYIEIDYPYIKSISYRFIWVSQQQMVWKNMIYSRVEGKVYICNYMNLQTIKEHITRCNSFLYLQFIPVWIIVLLNASKYLNKKKVLEVLFVLPWTKAIFYISNF